MIQRIRARRVEVNKKIGDIFNHLQIVLADRQYRLLKECKQIGYDRITAIKKQAEIKVFHIDLKESKVVDQHLSLCEDISQFGSVNGRLYSVMCEIGDEVYSLVEPLPVTSLIVMRAKEDMLGPIDLEVLIDDLGRLGNCVRIAYHGVAGDAELQIKMQRIGYDIINLYNEPITHFKKASNVCANLQASYQYLLDSLENRAIETLADMSGTAKGMAEAAGSLYVEFEQQSKTIIVLEEVQRKYATLQKEEIETKARIQRLEEIHDERCQQLVHSCLYGVRLVENLQYEHEVAKELRMCKERLENVQCLIEVATCTIGGLKCLAPIMLQAARFCRCMQYYCDDLAENKMKADIERALKLSEERRFRVWTSNAFKTKAIRYYAQWIALDNVCTIYTDRIKLIQRELYTYIQETLATDEAHKIVLVLVKEFGINLKKQQAAIEEKRKKWQEEIAKLKLL